MRHCYMIIKFKRGKYVMSLHASDYVEQQVYTEHEEQNVSHLKL